MNPARIELFPPFPKIRPNIPELKLGAYANRILVLAPLALYKGLWRNQLAKIAAKLERMVAPQQRDVVNNLIVVLDGGLWRIGIRANTAATEDKS